MTTTSTPAPPILRRWRALKANHPHCVLVLRAGDVYAFVGDDAWVAANHLNRPLSGRDGVTITAIAADRLDEALQRLIRAGYRVAVCEPTDAETARTVKRDMQRALIPGTLHDD